jgi:hypothetical protein
MLRLRTVAVLCALAFALVSDSRGERVGYSFSGAMLGSGKHTTKIFGISVPNNSPVTGTFSYDTTVAGTDVVTGEKAFHQSIEGGYTLNINNGAIRLSASDYIVTVAVNSNELSNPPFPIDFFGVDYSVLSTPPPTTPILVNGVPWTGASGAVSLLTYWDAGTFTEPDEPKLTSDRPATPDAGFLAYVGGSPDGAGSVAQFSNPPLFSISPISPTAGDYNVDGKIDANDIVEWQRAFGRSDADSLFADGNHDGVVDAADYTVWRSAMGPIGASAAIPEPASSIITAIGILSMAGWFGKRERTRVRSLP